MKSNHWYYGVVIIVSIMASFVVISTLTLPGGARLLVVESGSMEPTINTGSLILIRPDRQYKKGDIVSFKDDNQKSITHRIFKVDNGQFATKGDANDAVDNELINPNQIEGKVIFWLSYFGTIMNFLKNKTVTSLLIVVPATLIVAREIYRLKELLKQ